MINNEAAIQQNLKYIKKSLESNTHQAQQPILTLMISETIQLVRETSFIYEVPLNNNTHIEHFRSYANRGLKAKASLIADMEDLQMELKKGNVKRCLAVIDGMLSSDLYTNPVKNKISKWVPLRNVGLKTKQIIVE
ncbi:hypothetical protein V7068_21840 [Bacillus sp. JJ634]